jgi:class 3 adenylate cyclase
VDSLDVKRHLTCILSADAVGYSSQMARDEEGTIRVLAAHRAVIDGIIAFHQGRIVGTAGDSVLAEFPSAVEGVRCATEIQDAIRTRNDSLPEERRMLFRIGVNLGDVVVKNGDLLGDGVNVAARLQSIAEPGGICISSSVYDQITGKLDLGFRDIGDQTLKNINRPIHVYRVSGATQPVRAAPPSSVATRQSGKRMVAVGAVAALLVGAAIAWQLGWIGVGHDGDRQVAVPAVPPAAVLAALPRDVTIPAQASADAQAQRAQAEADSARIRAEAEALKRQAQAEATRARAEAEAARIARTKADAEAAAARIRAQAEADAARIRDAAEKQAAKLADAGRSAPAAAPSTSTATSEPPTPVASQAAATTAFDGAWKVTIRCEPYGKATEGLAIDFVVGVKDGYLHGGRGVLGTPGSLRMEGAIAADGTARLGVRGRSGDPKYEMKGPIPPGSPYRYEVRARFEGASGTGTRAERPCDVRFSRQ